MQPLLVDEHAAAEMLDVSVGFLRRDRRTTRTIPVVRLGTAVRYAPEALRQRVLELQGPSTPAESVAATS